MRDVRRRARLHLLWEAARLRQCQYRGPEPSHYCPEEWLLADVAGVRDYEAHRAEDVSDEKRRIEVTRELLLQHFDHLLEEPLHRVVADIALVIALEFGNEGAHLESDRSRHLGLVFEGHMTADGVGEVRLLDKSSRSAVITMAARELNLTPTIIINENVFWL